MAGAGGGSRLLRATTKALKTDNNHKSSSTSANSSPFGIPSLKFPFLRETNKTQKISRRVAEQRAALIALGTATITPEKKMGIFPI
ncbi:hypothetical protein PR202_gb11024 [Eleusine coracana subsp. coracana]|uniref:Chlorophyll a-b binding protein, chloroplastic n=1 Tax=Eleusine coracana subsp. coracana TaxID=191504 RepID=A0AAV5EMC3_ELECO|nr:hypothetical protein PR202_gb11024 [Eleusine coracana subsp. coracana]